MGESIKGAELQAHVFGTELGYECNPGPGKKRTDIVQAIKLGDRKKVCIQRTELSDRSSRMLCFTRVLLYSSSLFVKVCIGTVLLARISNLSRGQMQGMEVKLFSQMEHLLTVALSSSVPMGHCEHHLWRTRRVAHIGPIGP